MLLPVLILALLVMMWAWREQGRPALRSGDIAAAVVAVAGAIGAMEGKKLGLLAIAFAVLWFWHSRRRVRPADPMAAAEARALLGLPPHADAPSIRAAHRRLIAQAHPDQGGQTDLAQRINAARDVLLDELNEVRPSVS